MVDAKTQRFVNPTARLSFRLTYRVMNRGYQAIDLDFDDPQHRELARLIRAAEASNEPLGLDLDTVEPDTLDFLRELGLVVSPAEIPGPAGASIDLATRWLRPRTGAEYDHPAPSAASRCVVNANVWQAGEVAGRIPARWYHPSADFLGIDENTLFVENPATLFTSPCNLHERAENRRDGNALAAQLEAAWADLRAGRAQPADLPPDILAALRAACLLIDRDARADTGTARWARWADQLASRGYAVLRNVIDPVFAETLREYCWSLLRGGWLQRDDGQVERRWYRHNDPVLRSVHRALVPLISRVTAPAFAAVKAAYAYLGIYERDAILTRHRDRPQCRWNLSMPLGTVPHRPRQRQWPIFLDVDGRGGQPQEVTLGVSDALLYPGQDIEHWRERLTDLQHCAVCFFHFVDWDFTGALE